jgi:hypothetical protein
VDNVVSLHNEQIWESKQLFSYSFAKLLYKISHEYSFDKEGKEVMDQVRNSNLHDFDNLPKYSGKQKWVSTFHRQALTIIYFHTVILRSTAKTYLKEYCDTIRHSLSNYFPVAFFYIENFCKLDIITEFITYRKLSVLRMQVPYFIKIACKRVYEEEEEMIAQYCDLIDKYGDNVEKIVKKCQGEGYQETFYEEATIQDNRGKLRTSKELIVYLHDNDHNVPVLIVFANKLIKTARDLYEDINNTNKYHSLVNFFELFFNLAEAGPEIKRYMIQSKFMSRLIDIYYYRTSMDQHKLRDLSHIPQYEIFCNERKNELIKSATLINPEISSMESDEEVDFDFGLRFQKRKDAKDDLIVGKGGNDALDSSLVLQKGNRESDDKRFAYLLRFLSCIICSCKFTLSGTAVGEDSPFCNTSPANIFPDIENDALNLLTSEKVISDLIITGTPTISTREALDDMYAHLCWENDDVSNNVVQIVVADVVNVDSCFTEVIKQTRLIANIAKLKDRLSETRMKYIIKHIFVKAYIEDYHKFIKYADSLLNMTLELIKRNYDACKYMRELPDIYEHIEKFHRKHPIPLAKSKSQVLFKNISKDRVEKYLTTQDQELIKNYTEYRMQQFEKFLVDIDFQDSIEELITREEETVKKVDLLYEKGDIVDYYKEEFKFWIEANIIEDYGPIMQVGYKVPSVIVNFARTEERKTCVKINKDSIRPEGIYTSEMLCNVNGIYEYLYMKSKEYAGSRYM